MDSTEEGKIDDGGARLFTRWVKEATENTCSKVCLNVIRSSNYKLIRDFISFSMREWWASMSSLT